MYVYIYIRMFLCTEAEIILRPVSESLEKPGAQGCRVQAKILRMYCCYSYY